MKVDKVLLKQICTTRNYKKKKKIVLQDGGKQYHMEIQVFRKERRIPKMMNKLPKSKFIFFIFLNVSLKDSSKQE